MSALRVYRTEPQLLAERDDALFAPLFNRRLVQTFDDRMQAHDPYAGAVFVASVVRDVAGTVPALHRVNGRGRPAQFFRDALFYVVVGIVSGNFGLKPTRAALEAPHGPCCRDGGSAVDAASEGFRFVSYPAARQCWKRRSAWSERFLSHRI